MRSAGRVVLRTTFTAKSPTLFIHPTNQVPFPNLGSPLALADQFFALAYLLGSRVRMLARSGPSAPGTITSASGA